MPNPLRIIIMFSFKNRLSEINLFYTKEHPLEIFLLLIVEKCSYKTRALPEEVWSISRLCLPLNENGIFKS